MSKEYPCHFQLYDYSDAIAHSETISVCETMDKIWLKLPNGLAKYLTLYQLIKLGPENNGTEVDIADKIQRDTNRTWLTASRTLFDMTAGFHMYQLVFLDSFTQQYRDLYFCYHIQDNDPEKPYIYMNREEEES